MTMIGALSIVCFFLCVPDCLLGTDLVALTIDFVVIAEATLNDLSEC